MRSYTEAIKDGETGYIVKSADEFIEKILYLKSNPAIAAKMGIAARQDVMANYDIRKRYPEYRDAIIGATQVIQTAPPQDRIEIVSSNNKLYIPPIEGGPRSFYENMKQWLPIVSKKEWEVTTILKEATAAIAIAFIYADEIIAEKKVRPELKIIYRLDGLPMDFEGNLEPTNLSKMQEMFRHADFIVWQSLHCQKMWRDANIMLPEINPEGPIIPNGVDLEIFTSQGNQYNFPSFRKYNFLNLNWSAFKHKRIDLLKDIIKSYESSPDVKFYLIGNYINTSQIANINFWKECSNVLYLGQMRNQSIEAKKLLASIYRASRAIIFTSEMEGSPHFALEAAACGCPIIYNSNADIIPELFPTGSLPIEQFDKIFDDSIREMLHANILQEIQNYSIEKCVTKYLEVLSCNKLS
jgi:glycosyltransferase involved in cell wall biosynthesis